MCGIFLCAMVLSQGAVWADQPKSSRDAIVEALDQKMKIDVSEADVAAAFGYVNMRLVEKFNTMAESGVVKNSFIKNWKVISCDVDEMSTYKGDGVSIRAVISNLCKSLKCKAILDDTGLSVISEKIMIDTSVYDEVEAKVFLKKQ